ncbi:MAG TPA: YukJ family protein [Chloroflexota bacterium]|nr:YukJ family protein [Chloroflexota bacterium]
MPLKNYGVLKGRAVDRRFGTGDELHYQVHVNGQGNWRIAINVHSKVYPSELDFLIEESFHHTVLENLPRLPFGFTPVDCRPGGLALDFVRSNLFDRQLMRRLPHRLPGPDNDLNDHIDRYFQRAIRDEGAVVYAYGERWGPERANDRVFGFRPANGIHDIHMNQGNDRAHAHQDGTWQDGAVLISFPAAHAAEQWVGIFLKFGSQMWHTDDTTGHRSRDLPLEVNTVRSG